MLIGMAITLVMMAAVVNLFANIGQSVRTRRAGMEMNGQLRMARSRLYKDLAGATCPAKPWREPGNDEGYLEIIEGQWSDKNPGLLVDGVDNGPASTNPELDYSASLIPGSNLPFADGGVTDGRGLGDFDDILALTVQSDSEPFVGRGRMLLPRGNISEAPTWVDATIKSNKAEVVWYAIENPADGSLGEPGLRTVYRRVFLIAAWYGSALYDNGLGTELVYDPALSAPIVDFQNQYDISVKIGKMRLVPNTLGDLTRRENRFGHNVYDPEGFPFPNITSVNVALSFPHIFPYNRRTGLVEIPGATDCSLVPLSDDREGEDVVLNDILGFDIRVFDPGAPLFEYAGTIVEPVSDNVFATVVSRNTPVGYGTYVDLGWDDNYDYDYTVYAAPVPQPLFQEERLAGWHPRVPLPYRGTPAVYDTWSTHYESDGIDQDDLTDEDAGTDQGTNGFDDIVPYDLDNNPNTPPVSVAINGTDDVGERETSPPYDVPLSGMQVKFRIYERDTRQIREATVTKNFSD